MKHTGESQQHDPSLLGKSKRHLALAVAPLLLAVACATSPQNTEATTIPTAPTATVSMGETLKQTTPEEKVKAISSGLNKGEIVRGVKTAVDYNLIYPSRDLSAHPDGISNPFILGDGIYGYTDYNDDTGEAQVLIAPAGASFEEAFPASAHIPESQRPVNPRIAEVDISRVYYQGSGYSSPSGRYYVTAIGEQPGFVPQTNDVQRAGDPMQVGK